MMTFKLPIFLFIVSNIEDKFEDLDKDVLLTQVP